MAVEEGTLITFAFNALRNHEGVETPVMLKLYLGDTKHYFDSYFINKAGVTFYNKEDRFSHYITLDEINDNTYVYEFDY